MATYQGTSGNDHSHNDPRTGQALKAADAGGADTLDGFGGDDFLQGYGGSDIFHGGEGTDRIYGYSQFVTGVDGGDYLYGEGGNDFLNGDGGGDFLVGGAGSDRIDGGDGSDTASYQDATDPVTINLMTGEAQSGAGATFQKDTLVSVENVSGSDFDDTIIGNSDGNILSGGDGGDTLTGGGGNDTLDGNGGSNTAVYAGDRANYAVVQAANGDIQITDNRTPQQIAADPGGESDGTDTLRNIELFQFKDATYTAVGLGLDDYGNSFDSTNIGSLTAGETKPGAIETGFDEDFFAVTLDAGTEYTFRVQASIQGQGTLPLPILAVYGSGGYADSIAEVSARDTPDVRYVYTPAVTGVHYLVVSGDFDDTGTYKVSVEGGTNAAPAGAVTITGDAVQGETLTAGVSTIGDADGLGTFFYQWLRGAAEISGAVGRTHLVNQADVGQPLSVRVSYTDGGGTEELLTSAATAPAQNVNDAPTGALELSGEAVVGGTVMAGPGTLADADGLGTLSYQWLRSGAVIAGAASTTYAPVEADAGSILSVRVSYTDGFGTDESVTSAFAGPVEVPGRTIAGTAGGEMLEGGGGGDMIFGRGGADTIHGKGGADSLFGGGQYDTIYAGDGDDRVWGGNGRDRVYLEGGDDVFRDNAQGGRHGGDSVFGGDGNDLILGQGGGDVLFGWTGSDVVRGGLGNDRIYGGGQYDRLFGGGGRDKVWGGDGRDTVNLGAGDDIFRDSKQNNNHGNDTVFGDDGSDRILGGGGRDTFYGESGNDLIRGGIGHDRLYGGGHYDTLHGDNGHDRVWGGDGRDTAYLGAGNDRFWDNGQNDKHGGDTVSGGNGADTIHIGGGNNRATGGFGADVFLFNGDVRSGMNVITDYSQGVDILKMKALAFSDLAFSATGSGVEIGWDNGSVKLDGIGMAAISQDDFLFF